MNENPHTSAFTTSDLGCCAALLCAGNELIALDRRDSKKVLFLIRYTKDVKEQANQYWKNTLVVPARGYFDSIKALKNRLYSE